MSFTPWQASRTVLAALALGGGVLAAATPVAAQDEDARLRKVEAEIRALQRKVFPGPDGKFFEPEVVTPGSSDQPQQQVPVGTPSTGALTDILSRLDSLEAQLSRLTAKSEENANAISQLEDRVDALEAHEAAAAPANAPAQPTGAIPVPAGGAVHVPEPATAAATPTPPPAAAAKPAAGPSADRVAAVKAITMPDTGDKGEDEYTYGYRLWDAGFFPEAEQQLKMFVEKYPDHRLVSYGRNLLGRAYLDDKQPRTAATYFLENYQKDPTGARAPDSLLYLAESMVALKDQPRACRALAEFGDKYPALAVGRLQDQYDKDRKAVTCK